MYMENIKRQSDLIDIIHKHIDERVCHRAAELFRHLSTADGKACMEEEIDEFILKHKKDDDKDKDSDN